MIPRIVHQIYGIFDDGVKLKDISEFRESTIKTEKYCIENDIEYKMWDLPKCLKLLNDYPEYKQLWDDFPQKIQRADFIRYLILHKYGGIYLDCDVHPIRSMEQLFDEDIFFSVWASDKKQKPYNAIFGASKANPVLEDIFKHCQDSFYEKSQMDIYKSWTGRFVFQTTGHHMIQRVLKMKHNKGKVNLIACVSVWNNCKNICDIPDDNKAVFFDNNRSYWYKDVTDT
jgi:mannosyltransferase OCH1-like enzyme